MKLARTRQRHRPREHDCSIRVQQTDTVIEYTRRTAYGAGDEQYAGQPPQAGLDLSQRLLDFLNLRSCEYATK